MLVNFIVWKINFTLFPTKESFQLCKIFSVYKKLSLESYFSLAPFPFFHSSRWQVITKTDNFYKDHNMLFNLQCSYRFSLPYWGPKRVSNHLLRHLFTSYLENIIIYWLYIYVYIYILNPMYTIQAPKLLIQQLQFSLNICYIN